MSDSEAKPRIPAVGNSFSAAVSVATTEHFTLQTARSTTVSEANSRASGYLAVLSSTLIALAFIGTMAGLSATFYVVASLLLPVVAFIGLVTFGRLVQVTNEDIAYAQRIARLREFYVEAVPQLEDYLTIVRGKAANELLHRRRGVPPNRQLFLTVAGMIAVVNSVVIGTASALTVAVMTSNLVVASLTVGLSTGAASLLAHIAHQRRVLQRGHKMVVDEFGVVVLPKAD
jgi:ABC-type bacteriocin/lantibiotic exporter with double-glycine peptidase domain